jgi:hypothetical protein
MHYVQWKKCRKKPVVVLFREVHPGGETIDTLEGALTAKPGKHLIIRGVHDEEYPIERGIFEETYDVLEEGE